MKLPAILCLMGLTVALPAQTLQQSLSRNGSLIVTQFVTAPFPHPDRAQGHRHNEKFYPAGKHYSDSTVAIFTPDGFRETERVDFVIHFHGWYNTVAGTLSRYKLIEQFVASGKNAVLVAPEGPHDAPDSFGGKLEDADGFKRFMDETIATLRRQQRFQRTNFSMGNIILSGHSGGYRVMAAILDRGGLTSHIKEVWIFDGLYAQTENFLTWWEKHRGRLVNIYTDGGGTKDDSEALMNLLKKRELKFFAGEESSVAADALQTNRLIFLHSDLGHNDVLEKRKQFLLLLETSCLENISKTSQ